ncbi:Asp23/Gls24 family envelope stress response protein [Leuconostocaceae bacterium ESL0958]|nr:Asp23/Gls24 family envelope stress response protein [Leuconostocaceae bacterium ESL0958]
MAKQGSLTNKNFLLMAEEMSDGQTMVAKTAVELMAQNAAEEVEGVVAMHPSVYDRLPRSLSWTGRSKGVNLRQSGDELILDLAVVLEYGVVVPKVAFAVQQAVHQELAVLAGIDVAAVNVTVAALAPDQATALDPNHLFDQSEEEAAQ